MNDCIFKHDPPRQDCSQCMNPPKPSATSKPVEGYFKATLDYAPKTNGKKFAKWCEDHGFTPLNGGRRAWSGSLQTYLRSADGVAYIDGEPFLFDEDDLVDLDKQVLEGRKVDGNTSDGYHTFNELYEFRMLYNAHLFNEWGRHKTYPVMKSKKHSDGQPCFDGTYFIVVALLPTGQISNHYKLKYWDIFDITEYEQVPWEFDNHTPKDVAKRLLKALQTNNKEKK